MFSIFVGENYFIIPEQDTKIQDGVFSSVFGEFLVKENKLTFSSKGGLEPVTITNEKQGWFIFENGSFVSDWKSNTITAFGKPKNLLSQNKTLPNYVLDNTTEVKVDGSCRYTYSLAEPEKIKSIDVANSCTPEELEVLLASFILKGSDLSTGIFKGFVDAYWSFTKAVSYINQLFERYKDVKDFGWPRHGNTCLSFKGKNLSTIGEYDSVYIPGSFEDCGISIILKHKDAIYGCGPEPIHPFSLVPHTTRSWQDPLLRPLSMLLERHGWKVFKTLLTSRHFETMEVFDNGSRAFAELMVERYGIEYVPSGVESCHKFFLRKFNGKDINKDYNNFMNEWKLFRHRADLRTAYCLWGDSFLREIIAAASVTDVSWIGKQKVHSRIFQSSDGVLKFKEKTDEYPIAKSTRLMRLQAENFLVSDNLVTGKNSENVGTNMKLKGFLSPPISAPAFFNSEVELYAFAFRPKTSSVVVAILEWGLFDYEVRAIRLFADGNIKPIKLNDTKLRFSFAVSDGACLMFEEEDLVQTEEQEVLTT